MKRIIRALICEIWTMIKFILLKAFHWKRFQFGLINVCSPMSEVDISRKGTLIIGEKFRMRSNCHLRVRGKASVTIGKNVTWNYGCMVVGHEQIEIGDNVQFGPNVLVYDHDHDFRVEGGLNNSDFVTKPVKIGNNVWIGANVVILRGTQIEDGCVVASGSVLNGTYETGQVIVQKRHTSTMPINGRKE